MNISRNRAAEQGMEAVAIIEAGEYVASSGKTVTIAEELRHAVGDTVSYPPTLTPHGIKQGKAVTDIRVCNETSLAAARNLITHGCNPVMLNFASATSPGGGFLRGARAQEEYLARSSGLYACLTGKGNQMYKYHKALDDPLYSNYAIYSPDVPVIRSDDGDLLEKPDLISIITCPAVNAAQLELSRHPEIGPAMWDRILKVLAIGLAHGHDAIVLGAWGCGAFGNDGAQIAGLFRRALHDTLWGTYERVIFAILDKTPEQRFIGPFLRMFGQH